LQQDGSSGTRTLRLIAMSRLWPIYDLGGEQFWNAFWQCVTCHYRLWMNGIYHGDISLTNLMYGISPKTRDPVGIINDFDLASWVDHPATNNDRTGTIPFLAIDLLDGGWERCIPRLYRHDMESFSWVLAYITVAQISYHGGTIEISSPPSVAAWFHDGNQRDRIAHITSKESFHLGYGGRHIVSARYYKYLNTIRQITRHWSDSSQSRKPKGGPMGPNINQIQEEPVLHNSEVDDPAGSLKSLIKAVGESLGDDASGEGFEEVKARLLEAIKTPTIMID